MKYKLQCEIVLEEDTFIPGARSNLESRECFPEMFSDFLLFRRAVVSGVAGSALAPPEFRSSVNPIPTSGGRLCPPQSYLPLSPSFSDLPTALQCAMEYVRFVMANE